MCDLEKMFVLEMDLDLVHLNKCCIQVNRWIIIAWLHFTCGSGVEHICHTVCRTKTIVANHSRVSHAGRALADDSLRITDTTNKCLGCIGNRTTNQTASAALIGSLPLQSWLLAPPPAMKHLPKDTFLLMCANVACLITGAAVSFYTNVATN